MSQNELWNVIGELQEEVKRLREQVDILARRSLLDEYGKDLNKEPIPEEWRDAL